MVFNEREQLSNFGFLLVLLIAVLSIQHSRMKMDMELWAGSREWMRDADSCHDWPAARAGYCSLRLQISPQTGQAEHMTTRRPLRVLHLLLHLQTVATWSIYSSSHREWVVRLKTQHYCKFRVRQVHQTGSNITRDHPLCGGWSLISQWSALLSVQVLQPLMISDYVILTKVMVCFVYILVIFPAGSHH